MLNGPFFQNQVIHDQFSTTKSVLLEERLFRSQIRSLAKEIADLEQELEAQRKENQILTALKELNNSSCQTGNSKYKIYQFPTSSGHFR